MNPSPLADSVTEQPCPPAFWGYAQLDVAEVHVDFVRAPRCTLLPKNGPIKQSLLAFPRRFSAIPMPDIVPKDFNDLIFSAESLGVRRAGPGSVTPA